MIEAHAVSKSFGAGARAVHAVRSVSFSIAPGRVTGLLGPNGAGKTTLIRMITAYLAPSAGFLRVCGHDTVDAGDRAKGCLGYLPESAPLYPEMSVEGYLAYRARLFGVRGPSRRTAIDRSIRRCWLDEVRGRRIGALSKGYRQRVGLAAALLHDPAVIVLDEPTSGLDPSQIREMRDLIRSLAGEPGRTVLLSSHILPEVEQTCDRVLILARGRLRADGTPDELLEPHRRVAPYIVECAADPTAAQRTLAAVAGVAAVRPAGTGRFEVCPVAGAPDLREPLARAAAASGLILRELTRAHTTLEQVFLRVIESADEPSPPAVPGRSVEVAA